AVLRRHAQVDLRLPRRFSRRAGRGRRDRVPVVPGAQRAAIGARRRGSQGGAGGAPRSRSGPAGGGEGAGKGRGGEGEREGAGEGEGEREGHRPGAAGKADEGGRSRAEAGSGGG